MHDTRCLRLVHWGDPERWYGEGGIFTQVSSGQRVQHSVQNTEITIQNTTFSAKLGVTWDPLGQASSVQFSCSVMSNSLQPHGLQHARPPCPLSQWCHPTISFSVVPFSSHLPSFAASGSFPMSQFFASGGQSIGVSVSASVLPVNTQDWSPLGWTDWILSRVFSNTTVQKYQFFCAQFSL